MQTTALLKAFARAAGRAAGSFWRANRFNDCAAISFYSLLSIAPLASLVIVAMSRFMGVTAAEIETVLEQGGVLVPEFGEVFNSAVAEMVRNRASIEIVSVVVTIWFASFVFGSIQTAFDRIFRTVHAPIWGMMKPQVATLTAGLLLMLGFFLNTLATLVRSVDSPLPARLVALLDRMTLVPIFGSFVLDASIFMLVLYTLPPRRLHDWRMVIPAALVGAVGWRIARAAFGYYVAYASSRLTFTGSAGAAVIFMLWIYYAALVLLYSAELLAALDTARREAAEPAEAAG